MAYPVDLRVVLHHHHPVTCEVRVGEQGRLQLLHHCDSREQPSSLNRRHHRFLGFMFPKHHHLLAVPWPLPHDLPDHPAVAQPLGITLSKTYP